MRWQRGGGELRLYTDAAMHEDLVMYAKLGREEFLDVESVQQSRGLASRRVNFGERTGAWSGRRKEGRIECDHRLCAPKQLQEMTCTN